jgi:hypothetical protein
MSIEVMKQALDALKKAKDDADNYLVTSQQDVRIMGHIVSLIEAELAKPEQEPVAWMYKGNFHDFDPSEWASPEFVVTPLFTAPPKREWVGLTDDEIDAHAQQNSFTPYKAPEWFVEVSRDIEAKLRERNT